MRRRVAVITVRVRAVVRVVVTVTAMSPVDGLEQGPRLVFWSPRAFQEPTEISANSYTHTLTHTTLRHTHTHTLTHIT